MENYKNWLVVIDPYERSKGSLSNIFSLARRFHPDSICFLSTVESMRLPDGVAQEFPGLRLTNVESIKDSIQSQIDHNLPDSIVATIEIGIQEPIIEYSKVSKRISADLLLIGNQQHSNTTLRKVVRKSPCTVLIVPSTEQPIKSILLALDYSDYSIYGTEIAANFSAAYDVSRVKALHIHRNATHYVNPVIETPFELKKVMEMRRKLDDELSRYMESRLSEFDSANSTIKGLSSESFTIDKGTDVEDFLNRILVHHLPDLIIIGASETRISKGVYHSLIENSDFSFLNRYYFVVKEKHSNQGLFQSMANLFTFI